MRKATRRLLERLGIQRLYPPQEAAIEAGVEHGESILLASPTASGKTLVGLIASVNSLQDYPDSMIVYVAPLRSIIFEKQEDFKVLEGFGAKVRVEVGDYSIGPRDANVILATYEKLDSMLRSNPGLVEKTSLLIIDEIHYVGDEKRGPVLESLASIYLSGEGHAQILALSATVPNAAEIASWLNARLVESRWRPVPLREGVYRRGTITYADGSQVEVRVEAGVPYVDLAIHYAQEAGQVIVFSQSRRRVVSTAKVTARYSSRLYYDESIAREAAAEIMESQAPRTLREELARLVAKGVAYHHAGLGNSIRRIVEEAFRRGGLAVVHATPTLAAGVNLPARAVVLEEYTRFEGGRRQLLAVAEYKQMAGRAGRPGYDRVGDAIIIAKGRDTVEELLETFVKAAPEPVSSRLGGLRGMRHLLLGLVASGLASSMGEAAGIVARTLFAREWGVARARSLLEVAARDLERWGLLESHGELLEATPLGLEVARLYMDPYSVPVARRLLAKARVTEPLALYAIASMPDMPRLPVSRREEDAIVERILEEAPEVGDVTLFDDPMELAAAKTALLLLDWVREEPEDVILERYGAGPGDVAGIAETGAWLAGGLARIAHHIGVPAEAAGLLSTLARRIRYGVREELLPLVSIPGVGRVRARRLYNHGYRSLLDLARARPQDLVRVPGIGPSIARQILEYLGVEVEGLPEGRGRGIEKWFT